jgi:hypothetical protein
MSLLRLLTAGRSLVGLKKSERRFHVTRQRLLPKFVSGRNPFGKSAQEPQQTAKTQRREEVADRSQRQPIQEPVSAALEPQAAAKNNNIVSIPASPERTGLSAPSGNPTTSPQQRGSSVNALAGRLGRLAGRMRKLLIWRGTQSARLPIPRFNKQLVQGELSLDRVRVVRNDLSDTDLEIVRSAPQKGASEPSRAKEKEQSAAPQPATSGLVRRLFAAGKT